VISKQKAIKKGTRMANPEHLHILRQGVKVWNQWRQAHHDIDPDLSHAVLNQARLTGVNFAFTNLNGALLEGADLRFTNLIRAQLAHVNVHQASLIDARLGGATLTYANLSEASLYFTDFTEASLREANLSNANMTDAVFTSADLADAELSNARLWRTLFADVDLSTVKGLDTVKHIGPSYIDLSTIARSHGTLPDVFLRGAGVADAIIDSLHPLVSRPTDYATCFISYSHEDQSFADQLYADLQSNGVRCWFAPEDMKIGDKIRVRIAEAIHLQDKLLLLLSKHAIASTWVENEVEAALEKEQRQQREMLFPIRLDESVMQTSQPWAASLRRARHIGDFTCWKDPQEYQRAFERLLRDLKAETEKEEGK
jgi:TIR domain/Pentapeptide repeats (8 copies)